MKNTQACKIIAGSATLFGCVGAAPAAVSVAVDLDTVTAGVQSSRTVSAGEIFTVGLVMTADAAGVSSYGVSVSFDNAELSLNGAPAASESLPGGFTFNFTVGVASESQPLGQVLTFEAATFGSGPVSSSFTIGTISFMASAPVTDAFLDVTPGLFNAGIDGIFDNGGGDLGPGAVFSGGIVNVVPEPAGGALLTLAAASAFTARRRRSRWQIRNPAQQTAERRIRGFGSASPAACAAGE